MEKKIIALPKQTKNTLLYVLSWLLTETHVQFFPKSILMHNPQMEESR